MLVRLLLNPFGADGGGSTQSSQTPAPSATETQGPAYGSPERMPVSPSSSQGSRDFSYNNSEPTPNDGRVTNPQSPTQGQPQATKTVTPADPNFAPNTQGQPSAATSAAQQAQWQSIRDAAAGLGYRFPGHVQDDGAALQHMVHQLQQRDYHSQLGQRLAPMAPQIQQYLQQGQGQQQPATPARKSWEAPAFDKRWVAMVEQDPATGMYLSKPGVPHEIGKAVNEYVDWKEKYDANPAAAMNEMVREAAREEAATLYQQNFQEQQTQGAARDIVRANANWFYAKDNAKQPIYDWQGNPTPSPAGLNYLRHLQQVRSYGIHDPRTQDQLAKQAMQVEWYQHQARQQQGQQQAAGAPAQFATQAANTNPLAGLSPQSRAAQPGNVEDDVDNDLASLKASLRRNIQQAGITDSDFMRQHAFEG